MTPADDDTLELLLDELWLDLDELCRMGCVEVAWARQRLDDGLLSACAEAPDPVRCYNAVTLARLRRIACLERDFDAVPELAALVADLEDELRGLRARLAALGG